MNRRRFFRAFSLALLLAIFAGAAQAQSIVGVLGIEREVVAIETRLQGSREVPVRGYTFRVGTHQRAAGGGRTYSRG